MSQPYHGRDMGQSPATKGSVRLARERAEAGLPRNANPQNPQPTRPRYPDPNYNASTTRPTAPPTFPIPRVSKQRPAADGRNGQAISRPTQVPQWPLAGPVSSPSGPGDVEPYRPPAGRPQNAPQRPPRPSRVPSMVDQARLQEATPTFLNPSSNPQDPQGTPQASKPAPRGNPYPAGQPSSSVGTIQELPAAAPARKSAQLGPPPSSRRCASSFYSRASYVSPILEENSRLRSHGSYASSSAMPDGWEQGSSAISPAYADAFYEESMTDKSRESTGEEFGDESKLVHGVKSRGNPTPAAGPTSHPAASPHELTATTPSPGNPFDGGTGYMDVSTSSSNTLPMSKHTPATSPGTTNNDALTSDAILKAYAAASSSDPADARKTTGSPRPFNRLSAIRRPPKLDIDAIRAAEARGSVTSLPDLIRRATKLAAMIDKGRRPTSRMDDLADFLDEKGTSRDGERNMQGRDRRQSGLSDMLAAFPPPVHTPQHNTANRSSWLRGSPWPIVPGQGQRLHSRANSVTGAQNSKKGRRCCGLPVWAFILIAFLTLCAIAAAVVVPLEFFVFKNLGNHGDKEGSLSGCQETLPCLNGGTNVISQGLCSCICTNGFTGSNCAGGGSAGCTTTNLVSPDDSESISNVTLGRAIPRLIADASSNFSIPLSGTTILAKLNSGNLSCIAQNSLVTLDGQFARAGEALAEAKDSTNKLANAVNYEEATVTVSGITVAPTYPTAISASGAISGRLSTDTSSWPSSVPYSSEPSATSSSATPTATLKGEFTATEEALDFARVAILFILQEKTVDDAETAQTKLQHFFSRAALSKTRAGNEVTKQAAASLNIGGSQKIDLVNFSIDTGDGPVGSKLERRSVSPESGQEPDAAQRADCQVRSYPVRH